jgi:alkylation response protein AidB-like acyl-CoA dehydrogenase
MTATSARRRSIGCWYFTETPSPGEGRFPETLSAEQREFQQAIRGFIESEVSPRLDAIDRLEGTTLPDLMRGLGELGFFQAEIPEEDGGLGLGLFATISMIEELGRGGSFHVPAMVHQGIGTQPIAYYGTSEQRAKYLAPAMTVDQIGAYALTEPSSGSDALAMKTTAVRDADGSWTLNGAKQFITNAGWADFFVVFGRVEEAKITAFIVARDTPGLEVTAEEHKMGIKGSSTCGLRLTNVKVADEQRLGEIGIGHKIALNLLNLGRLKLGTTVLGANKRILREAIRYAIERRQFDTRIADFGMTRMKIAECAAVIFAGEAIAYRTAGMMEDHAAGEDSSLDSYSAKIAAADAFSPECAAVKIHLSEGGCVVADHALQMLGGYGFIEEYPTARQYRDARIARLYEGTNEINRLHIVNTLMRRATRGEMGDGWLEVLRGRHPEVAAVAAATGVARLRAQSENLKALFGVAVNDVLRKLGDSRALKDEQEVTSWLADVAIECYAAESAVLRAEAIACGHGATEGAGWAEAFATTAVARSSRIVRDRVESILAAVGGGVAEMATVAQVAQVFGSSLEAERKAAAVLVDAGGEWPEFAPATE